MPSGDPRFAVATVAGVTILVIDSSTALDTEAAGQVVVCGSHGGETAALFAAAAGAKAVVLNDAGGGKDQAGLSGLRAVERYALAAATVDYRSARIGEGPDTYATGIISFVNRWAGEAGVRAGMAASEAATRMAYWLPPAGEPRPPTPAERPPLVLRSAKPRVVVLDSASQVNADVVGDIVLTGSHGGVVAGRAVRAAVAAAFFNDAGIGKGGAGIGRLPLLDRDGIPGATVACASARIGDGRDTFESGVLSFVNETADGLGLRTDQPAREAVDVLVRHFAGRSGS